MWYQRTLKYPQICNKAVGAARNIGRMTGNDAQHGDDVKCEIMQLLYWVKMEVEILLNILTIGIMLPYPHLFAEETSFGTSNAHNKVILMIHMPMSLLEVGHMLRLMM